VADPIRTIDVSLAPVSNAALNVLGPVVVSSITVRWWFWVRSARIA
jgi:hypothetical protein